MTGKWGRTLLGAALRLVFYSLRVARHCYLGTAPPHPPLTLGLEVSVTDTECALCYKPFPDHRWVRCVEEASGSISYPYPPWERRSLPSASHSCPPLQRCSRSDLQDLYPALFHSPFGCSDRSQSLSPARHWGPPCCHTDADTDTRMRPPLL